MQNFQENVFLQNTSGDCFRILYSAKISDIGRTGKQKNKKKKQKKTQVTEEWQSEYVPEGNNNKTDNNKFHVARNVESINFEIDLVRFHIVKMRYM